MLITFQQGIKREEIDVSTEERPTLLEIAAAAGIAIEADCAGGGTCGKCRVRVLFGKAGEPDASERICLSDSEIADGWRLACRLYPTGDLSVEIPASFAGSDRKKRMVKLPDWFVLSSKYSEEKPGETVEPGVAFDIGTTTVVGMLWDMKTGVLIDAVSRTNPQSIYGADVISRILFTMQEDENLRILQKMIADCLNDILAELVRDNPIRLADIKEAVIVGNTTMTHLFLGIDPASLARAPFAPGYHGPADRKADMTGLLMPPDANVHVLPNIAGHVGADIVGVLLATSLNWLNGTNMAIDIGTNGEILLARDGRTLTCSTAAGPAFEGASIRKGMRAERGAIEAVHIDEDGQVLLTVIDDATPVGICGSGLIDSVAVLLTAGLITETGKLLTKAEGEAKGLPKPLTDRLNKGPNGNEFILYCGESADEAESENLVSLTQKDIREVQLGKGAILAGIMILLQELGITEEQLDHIYLAGAFGNYIDKESALAIGLLPQIDVERVISVGNAAGIGASMALLSKTERDRADRLAEEVEHIELSAHPDFQKTFLNAMYLGKKYE